MWITEELDKGKPLTEYLGKIVLDENETQAIVTRSWTGDRVRSKEKACGQFGGTPSMYSLKELEELNKPQYSYHYENIKYNEPFFSSTTEFNKDGTLMIIGEISEDI